MSDNIHDYVIPIFLFPNSLDLNSVDFKLRLDVVERKRNQHHCSAIASRETIVVQMMFEKIKDNLMQP